MCLHVMDSLALILRCDQCASWSVDEWTCVEAYIDELQQQHEREVEEVKVFLVLYLWP